MTKRTAHDGFTVIELAITLLVSSVISVALAALLANQTRVERRASSLVANEEELRQAMLAIERDLRSAEPLVALGDSADNDLRLDLSIYPDITSTVAETLTWRVDTVTRELLRELWGVGGSVTTTYRLRGVANTDADPLFRYFKANGLAFVPGVDPPADIAACTVRVRLNLTAAPNDGPAPTRLVSDVQLRNRQPGGAGCPHTLVTP